MLAAPLQPPTIRNKLHHGAPVETRPGLVVTSALPFRFSFRRHRRRCRRHRVRIVVRGATTTQVPHKTGVAIVVVVAAAQHRVLAVRVTVGVRSEQGGRGGRFRRRNQ